MPDPSIAMSPCFGVPAFGLCSYDPATPAPVYFSVGQGIGALAFTFAAQLLLRPIYRFRLAARYLPLRYLYALVLAGAGATIIAAIVPSFPILHSGPWGYSIVWELMAAILFIVPYGAVALAIIMPIRTNSRNVVEFARGAATLLSAATEADHLDFLPDLQRSLSHLIVFAAFVDRARNTSAFFDFTYRKQIERGRYAATLLRIIADPSFCESLVKRAPWQTANVLGELSRRYLHTPSGEEFVHQLAQQAVLRDDSMMTRELGFRGFQTAPLLSESLFSDPFIIEAYNPFDFFTLSGEAITPSILKTIQLCSKALL